MSESVLRIGASGHQQIGNENTIAFVSQQLRELLVVYQKQACEQGQTLLACSALAVGTDRLFVKTALELGIPVEVVIPCAGYAEIFPSGEARQEYQVLLEKCQRVHRLSHCDCSDDAYLTAGHWIVDHSDLVMLV